MPRTCSVCSHRDRAQIDAALVEGESFRNIAERFGLATTSLFRHKADHLPAALVQAQGAEAAADADDLLAQVRDLEAHARAILATAERACDYRSALGAIREARACLELRAKLIGELDERPQINVLLAPEWLSVRAVILRALASHPEARTAVAASLAALEGAHAVAGD